MLQVRRIIECTMLYNKYDTGAVAFKTCSWSMLDLKIDSRWLMLQEQLVLQQLLQEHNFGQKSHRSVYSAWNACQIRVTFSAYRWFICARCYEQFSTRDCGNLDWCAVSSTPLIASNYYRGDKLRNLLNKKGYTMENWIKRITWYLKIILYRPIGQWQVITLGRLLKKQWNLLRWNWTQIDVVLFAFFLK